MQVPFTSAPELPPICSAIFLKFIPLVTVVHVFVDGQQDASPCQVHFSGVNFEDVKTGVLIRRWEFNFPAVTNSRDFHDIQAYSENWFITRPVNATGSKEGRVKDVNPVRCHDHLK